MQSNPEALGLETNPRHEYHHQLGESIPPQRVNVLILPDSCLPFCRWLLAVLHLMIHPLYHALHLNGKLLAVLIILLLL
jgi:hypothetical protein